jgi:hypothetical protein
MHIQTDDMTPDWLKEAVTTGVRVLFSISKSTYFILMNIFVKSQRLQF